MILFSTDTKFWLKWLLLATIVFCASFFMSTRDQHFSQQWAKPDLPVYEPFRINHFTIAVNPADYAFLFSDRPESLFTYQNAEVSVNRTPVVVKAKLRIRGTHSWNWDQRKPSFRLRQSGNKKIMARSDLNFALADDPSMLANLVTDHIAVGQGIPSTRTTICTVTLNGDYKGLYHISEPVNPEAMAWQGYKNAALIEGNSRESRMWTKPEAWQIQILPDDDPDKPFNCLARMLKLVAAPVNIENAEQLGEVCSIDRLASWSALMTAICSIHTNDFFGNTFVYDRTGNFMFPIISDPTGFGVLTGGDVASGITDIEMPPYEFLTPILNLFFRVPQFQFKRNLALYQLLNNELHPENLRHLVHKYMSILKPLLYKEPYASALVNVPILGFPQKVPVSPRVQIADAERLQDFMNRRRKFLLELLTRVSTSIITNRSRSQANGRWYQHYSIFVSGHCPVEFDFSAMQGKILPDLDFDGILDDAVNHFYQLQRLYPGLHEDTDFSAIAPAYLQIEQRSARYILAPAEQRYVIGIAEDHLEECLEFLQNHGRNSFTGEKVTIPCNSAPMAVERPIVANPAVLHSWRNMADGKN